MKIMSVIPAAAASSTAYWISGLSTIGSISLGLALVTGRKRLPRPATGNTALVTLAKAIVASPFFGPRVSLSDAAPGHRDQVWFVKHRHAQFPRPLEFTARLGARD